MKKQLLTGALALSVLMGTTGMALAADMPAVDLSTTTAPNTAASIPASMSTEFADYSLKVKGDVNDSSFDKSKLADKKAYTAKTYAAEIEKTKTNLAALVKENKMKQADADKVLKDMEQALQQIKDGKLTIYYADMVDENGNNIGSFTFTTTSTDINNQNSDSTETSMTIKK